MKAGRASLLLALALAAADSASALVPGRRMLSQVPLVAAPSPAPSQLPPRGPAPVPPMEAPTPPPPVLGLPPPAPKTQAAPSAIASPTGADSPDQGRSPPAPIISSPGLWSSDSASPGLFLDGRWEGAAELDAGTESLTIRLFAADPETGAPAGGLVDMPSRGLFGFPIGELYRSSEGLAFTLLGEAPVKGRFELRGSPRAIAPGEPYAVAGTLRIARPGSGAEVEERSVAEGGFVLAFSRDSAEAGGGADFPIDTGRGVLPGSLLMPEVEEGRAVPVALIVSGGQADRDGNNYSVPGRSDALAELAAALRDLGIASLRYDRRGSGEAYRLAGGAEGRPLVDEEVLDARAAIALLAADARFSSILVIGYADAELVASLAVAAETEGPGSGRAGRIAGMAALCSSGRSEYELLERYLSAAPEELRTEAAAILSALREGRTYPDPSPYFAGYFRPGLQPYLISLFRQDPRASFAALRCRALVVAGGSDLQVALGDTELLAEAKPEAAYRVVPGMSHALKAVGDDEEANFASFTDPTLPIAEGLAPLLAAFARGDGIPGEDPREGGRRD